MSVAPHVAMVAGALAMGYLVIGLLFLRFWSRTADALFLSFSIAFGLIALGQVAAVILGAPRENLAGAYLLRLAGFSLIILAVVRKNLGRRGPG